MAIYSFVFHQFPVVSRERDGRDVKGFKKCFSGITQFNGFCCFFRYFYCCNCAFEFGFCIINILCVFVEKFNLNY